MGVDVGHLSGGLIVLFGPAIAGVAIGNAGRTITRGPFALWVVGILFAAFVIQAVVAASFQGSTASIGFSTISMAVCSFLLYQRIARRAYDAGFEKWFAYVAILPVVNLVLIIVLLFKGSVAERSEIAADIVSKA